MRYIRRNETVAINRAILVATTIWSFFLTPSVGFSAETTIEEVIITAQKREERLQDVPISVAVINPATLEAFGMNEMTDIQYLVPGVQVSNSAGPRSFGYFIRGIGTTSFASESIESSVAFVMDGVVMGQAGTALTDMPDIERIEVLRGPQGTLFGKNSSAGVINVVTRAPTEELSTNLNVSYATPDSDFKASGLVSGALGERARGLISARVSQRDGIVDNVYDGRQLNDRNDWGARARVDFDVTDNFDLSWNADYWQRNSDCCTWVLRSVGTPPNAIEAAQLAAGIVPSPTNEQQNLDGPVRSDVESYGTAVTMNYTFANDLVLTSITSWRRWHTIDGLDTDSSPQDLYNVNYADFNQKQWSQEFRLTSAPGERFDYVAGLFYFESPVDSVSYQINNTSTAAFAKRRVDVNAETTNYAIFGQANWHVTPELTFITGARLLREESYARKYRLDLISAGTTLDEQEKTDDGFVWRLGAQYDFSPDFMMFATATQGYKGGGYDTGIGRSVLDNVEPEKPMNYEIGFRSTWPSAGLTFNTTLFHTIVEDYQISSRLEGPLSVYVIQNAAKLKSQGVEVDLGYRPMSATDLAFSGSVAYVDAIFDEFPNASCFTGQTAAEGCVAGSQDVSGDRVPFSSRWQASVQAHYGMPLASGSTRLLFDLGVDYRSDFYTSFPYFDLLHQDAFTLVNAAVGIEGGDGRWRVSLYGRNIGDEYFITRSFNTPLGSGRNGISQYPLYEARRSVGVSLNLSF